MDSNFWYRDTKAVDFRGIPGIAGAPSGPLASKPKLGSHSLCVTGITPV
jgi:hypothetical protein